MVFYHQTNIFVYSKLTFLLTKREIMYIIRINANMRIKIMGFFRLSNRLVPIYPQKYTSDILPKRMPVKNFLKLMLLSPAAMFTKNAGVNGTAVNTTN